MKITKHFSLEEFACKDGTPYPTEWIDTLLTPLCEDLEIIREEFGGKAITITSGYRTLKYNQKIGGALDSQHPKGTASDFKVEGVPARKVSEKVVDLVKSGKLKRIKAVGSYESFTHVDIRNSGGLVYWKL